MRKRSNDEPLEDFLDQVANDSAASLRKMHSLEEIRGIVFLHLNRTLEAGATLQQTAESIGVATARGELSEQLEDRVNDELELLGPILGAQYGSPS